MLIFCSLNLTSCRSDTYSEADTSFQQLPDTFQLSTSEPLPEQSINTKSTQAKDFTAAEIRNPKSAVRPQAGTIAKTAKRDTPPEYVEEPKREEDDQIFIDPKELNIDFIPNQLSYIYWDDETGTPLPYRPKLSQHVNIRRVVEYGENDRPPVFSSKCLDKTNTLQCSRQAVQLYVDNNIDHGLLEKQGQPKGVQYISFILDKQGKIRGNIRAVRSRDRNCEVCAIEAIRLVREMPDWQPAKLNGQVVSVRAVLPVQYRPAGN